MNILLETVRYFGKFYEYEGNLGWLPYHKAIIVKLHPPKTDFRWVKQSEIQFVKEL